MKKLLFIPIAAMLLAVVITVSFSAFREQPAKQVAKPVLDKYWFDYDPSGPQNDVDSYSNPQEIFDDCPGNNTTLCKIYVEKDPFANKPDAASLAALLTAHGNGSVFTPGDETDVKEYKNQ